MRVTRMAMLLGLVLAGGAASAQEPLEGYVIARKACNATISIRNAASESGTVLDLERAYQLIGENRTNGTHYYVVVPGAEPSRRWIDKSCGDWVKLVARGEAFERPGGGGAGGTGDTDTDVDDDMADAGDGGGSTGGTPSGGGQTGSPPRNFVLAISWQPAFCETHGSKAECKSQTEARFDADHFTLHGLWPQPRGLEYCGVSAGQKSDDKAGRWDRLPAVAVDDETRAALSKVMPGTQSMLERHEWTRHGTCYQEAEDAYFDDALAVIGKINASRVRELFAGAIGRSLTRAEIRAAFDEAFGAGAGERVRVACSRDGDRRLIGELTIGLVGEITEDPDVAALIAAAKPTDGGCSDGIVDKVGFQ
ncbi:ribonuclease T [Jiella endophytica]|uniref:Ribonuclease T n=1 Tax=Jiella endophytica TaxID=2558362 RepID=A0A4Y8RVF4_9HYPH|nr:ribonuclease T [Jiella endophytica]TFF27434.1 ribonuclease T [Jiella endophytica]